MHTAYVKKCRKCILVVKKPPRRPLEWLEPERKLYSLTFSFVEALAKYMQTSTSTLEKSLQLCYNKTTAQNIFYQLPRKWKASYWINLQHRQFHYKLFV